MLANATYKTNGIGSTTSQLQNSNNPRPPYLVTPRASSPSTLTKYQGLYEKKSYHTHAIERQQRAEESGHISSFSGGIRLE